MKPQYLNQNKNRAVFWHHRGDSHVLPHTLGVLAVISLRSSENQNFAVSLFMYRRHVLYITELRGIKILVFLFVLQEKELGFPFIPAEK